MMVSSKIKKNKTLYILGAGGHGKVCADIASLMKKWDKIYFLDRKDRIGQKVFGCEIINTIEDFPFTKEDDYIIGLGDIVKRAKLFDKLNQLEIQCANLVHPSAVVSQFCEMGTGIVMLPNTVVNAGAKLGNNIIINTGASVDHDCEILDNVNICPGVRVSGTVKIGKNTFIGTNACVIDGIKIGNHVIIGAGAVIIRDIPDNVVMVGNPAKVL